VRKSLRRDEIPELSAWSLEPNSPNNVERDETSATTASEEASVTTGAEVGVGVDTTGVASVLAGADLEALAGLETGVGVGAETGVDAGAGETAVVVGAEAEEEVFFAILLLVYITMRALFKYF